MSKCEMIIKNIHSGTNHSFVEEFTDKWCSNGATLKMKAWKDTVWKIVLLPQCLSQSISVLVSFMTFTHLMYFLTVINYAYELFKLLSRWVFYIEWCVKRITFIAVGGTLSLGGGGHGVGKVFPPP